MNALAPTLLQRMRQDLAARRGELREQLRLDIAADGAAHDEVHDQKDLAAHDARLAVDDAAQAHAAQELARVAAALQRLDDGSYGLCLDCGEAIAPARLLAMPAAPLCSGCQELRERGNRAR